MTDDTPTYPPFWTNPADRHERKARPVRRTGAGDQIPDTFTPPKRYPEQWAAGGRVLSAPRDWNLQVRMQRVRPLSVARDILWAQGNSARLPHVGV